jgi:von Willebrand factor type A domain
MTDNDAKLQRVRRDAGMTLPEVLISVLLTGLLIASMSMAITVVYKQRDNTEGRLNNARSEQSVGIWMPSDLSSAEVVNTDADASPCGATCPPGITIEGSNALMLTWTGSTVVGSPPVSVPTETKVSYRYMQSGDEWIMVRVECYSVNGGVPSCEQRTVLRGLDPPPPGIPGGWIPGQTKPYWVMVVSEALDPADIDGTLEVSEDPTYKDKNGQRVVVTINGGGDVEGLGGGTNQISLSAGGTERHSESLDPNDAGIPPTFIAARSRCGGNYGMLIDTSGSIGATNMGTVRTAVTAFISAFAGTPIKLQLVDFDAMAHTLGGDATTGVKYYDMLKESDVADLKLWVNGGGTTSTGQTPVQLTADGGTNWEDGLNRMFRKNDGTIQTSLPKTMIFFTDGEPTMTRLGYSKTSHGVTTFIPGTTMLPTPAGHPDDSALTEIADGQDYAQVAWNRANRIAREFGAQVNFIGVFVGAATNLSNDFVNTNVGYHLENWERGHHINYERGAHDGYQRGNNVVWDRGYHLNYQRGNNVIWERGYHDDYQRGNNVVWERGYHDDYQRGNNVVWERGYHLLYERNNNVVFERSNTGLTYEKKSGSTWSSQSAANYFANNTTPDSTDNWRVRITGTLGPTWVTTDMSQDRFDKTNTTSDSADGFRVRLNGSLSSTWQTVSVDQYNDSNTTADQSDGWRATKVYTAPFDTWESTTQSTYGSSNTTSAETDGWRTRQTAQSTSWTSVTAAEYNASNTTADQSDGWHNRAYTTPYSLWESTTQASYDASNTTSAATDGWRTRQTATSTSWTSVTAAEYNASNTTTDATDGWQIGKAYSSPYSKWESTTQSSYNSSNTTSAETDGWRTRQTATSTSWTSVTVTEYNASNTTSDSSDGWQTVKDYTSPFDTWESTTQSAYDAANTVAASTDGWRTRQTATSTSWTEVSAAAYNASNTTSDSSDGWRPQRLYTAPFNVWESSTQSAYDASNSTSGEDDGWRAVVSYTSPYTIWEPTDEASFIANNTGTDPTDGSDGWRATKIYIPPYTGYDATQTISMTNKSILGKLINPAGIIDPEDVSPADGVIDNPQTANMYATEDWAKLQGALTAIALGECGGTLTLQTRLTTGTNAPESFVYERSTDNKVVDTSATKRSGTFDFPLAGGGSVDVQITPHTLTNMTHYTPAPTPWTCKAGGLPVTPTPVDIPNTPWDAIRLTISANQAVSCIQNVLYTP